jgi:hypothetical protein
MSKAPPSKKTPTAAAATLTGAAGLAGWIEVFKAGSHIDASGKPCTFTQGDLDQMVTNHALGAAPAVLGHPKHDAPAYAWVGEYKRDGDTLFAKFKDINPAFQKGVADGAYRNRSVSVYPDKKCGWRVRHVGWLGAAAPAIDGLAPCEFAAPDAECLEFAAPGYSLVWGLESAARLMRKLRDQMIAKDGLEAADATLPQWEIDSMNESVTAARTQFNDEAQDDAEAVPAYFNQPGDPDMPFTQADLDKARTDGEAAAKATADAAAALATTNFTAAQTELATLRKERQTERIDAQIKGWKETGVILPADEPGLRQYMARLEDAGQEFTFSKAEGGEDKKTPAQFFANFMAGRKPVVKLGGSGAEDPGEQIDASSPHALAEAARSFMKTQADKGITVSLPDAMTHAVAQAKA